MSMSGLRRKRRNREGTVRHNHVLKLIDELRADLAMSREDMNQRSFTGSSVIDQEQVMHLIEQYHTQTQRQFQEIQEQIDRLHAERHSGRLEKETDIDGILPCCNASRRYFGTILWILAILGLIFGCAWNLREILQDMMESPTVTKMAYTSHENLSLPPIIVYQYGQYKSFYTQTLHAEKVFKALENGSLTEAYLEAIFKGVGIGLFHVHNSTVQPSEITEAYREAILRHGSLAEAGSAFYKEYGVACDEQFTHCEHSLSPPINCCNIFELLWGLNGPQYALKWNTIFLDAFHGFSVSLRSLPTMEAVQKGNFDKEPGNYQPYWIVISNGADQTGYDVHSFEVKPSEAVIIMLRLKRRSLKMSKDCVDLPPKLRYFRDYTVRNCLYERCYLNKLPLCNISCEIPLLQLISPDNLSCPPCEFDVINSSCWNLIKFNQPECSTNHGCRFPCNYTEVEYRVTKYNPSMDPREIKLYINYDTTEVQTFEETVRLTLWEYLSLISSILDLWLGITIYSLHKLLHRCLSKFTLFQKLDLRENSASAHSA